MSSNSAIVQILNFVTFQCSLEQHPNFYEYEICQQ